MAFGSRSGLVLALAVLLAAPAFTAPAMAEEHEHPGGPGGAGPGEPHPGPHGYQRPAEPQGWNARPKTFQRSDYQHNYQAARSFHIGPYHRPAGWVDHHWVFGEFLPHAYWAPNYFIADYWLFALEVPPVGFEWVRVDADALLINTANGEVLQVEYGVFA